jgi:hypothetical protein
MTKIVQLGTREVGTRKEGGGEDPDSNEGVIFVHQDSDH